MAHVRTMKTASGATAVQIVWSWRRGSRSIEHIGSAHDETALAALKTAAAARLTAGQTELDLGLAEGVQPGAIADDTPLGRVVHGLSVAGIRISSAGRQRIPRSNVSSDHRTNQTPD